MKVSKEHQRMPWYIKLFIGVSVIVAACIASGCGTLYVDERDGEVGVCFPLYGERDDGEEKSEDVAP